MDRNDAWRGKPGYQTRTGRVMGTIFTAVWLFYLIGPVVDLFTGHYSAAYRWSGLAIIVVFCAIYVMMVPKWPLHPKYGPHSLVALAVLAAIACVVYGGT